MTPLFMTSNKDVPLFFKELPLDIEEISRIPDASQPRNFMQALMQTMPNQNEVASAEVVNPIREALLDTMEFLTQQDKFIIDARYWEMITFAELGQRLGISAPHAHRLTDAAEKNLKELLLMNTTLRDYLLNESE